MQEAKRGRRRLRTVAKVISGEDDLPNELGVLQRAAGIASRDDFGDGPRNPKNGGYSNAEMAGDPESGYETEDDFYKQMKQLRAAKIAAKEKLYSRSQLAACVPEETAKDGKRHISYQMEKNRGLSRGRKRIIKNPRKKYRLKHRDTVVRRKGQVVDIRKPWGLYGGEESGINKNISKSIRFGGYFPRR